MPSLRTCLICFLLALVLLPGSVAHDSCNVTGGVGYLSSAGTAASVSLSPPLFSVAFVAPASNGGAAVSSYRLTCQPGNLTTQDSGSPLGFSGLVNGTAYSCGLAAITAFGAGAIAAFSVTPRTVPNAPTDLVATPYNASVRFDFSAPAFDGGAAITSYTARPILLAPAYYRHRSASRPWRCQARSEIPVSSTPMVAAV